MVDFLLERDEDGQGLAEYALILALIAVVAIVALVFLGTQILGHPFAGRRRHLAPRSRGAERRPDPTRGGSSLRVRQPTRRRRRATQCRPTRPCLQSGNARFPA